MPVTRLGLEGYGVRRAGSFSGKTPSGSGGPHPVGILTRLGLEGYGVQRAGSFSGKSAIIVVPALVPAPAQKIKRIYIGKSSIRVTGSNVEKNDPVQLHVYLDTPIKRGDDLRITLIKPDGQHLSEVAPSVGIGGSTNDPDGLFAIYVLSANRNDQTGTWQVYVQTANSISGYGYFKIGK